MAQTSHNRFLSLDVFRGMTICFMIIVNTAGSGAVPFTFLMHAPWHGFTPTDLVFPSFLFAVGNAMSFSMKQYAALGQSTVLVKILKRTVLIFIIGYLLYWFPFFKFSESGSLLPIPIRDTRIMGVLQRIALCYFFASLLLQYLSARVVLFFSAFILIAYWIILYALGNPHDPYSITGNACFYLDHFLFNETHLYHENGIAFDPEGILGTLPAMVNVIIGYYAGRFVQEKGKSYETIAKLLLAGSLFIFIALCWNTTFPVNKNLWTSSFVLLTTGIDLVMIAALIYTTEMRTGYTIKWCNFFVAFGKNPLFIYIISALIRIIMNRIKVSGETTVYEWLNNQIFQRIAPGAIGSLLFALSFMVICWCIVAYMDKKKIYIRV